VSLPDIRNCKAAEVVVFTYVGQSVDGAYHGATAPEKDQNDEPV